MAHRLNLINEINKRIAAVQNGDEDDFVKYAKISKYTEFMSAADAIDWTDAA